MTEEKNGSANSEMAPQEDGTKVPLAEEAGVKFSSNNPPNGDAKIDISSGQTFSGLTKEELMKYADDPFWVRLRWVLFIVFWAGWLAMLVMAIVIIIQAPRCAPKETLDWIQESAILQNVKTPVNTDEDVVKMASDLGIKTIYLEDLISDSNFENLNHMYDNTDVMKILKAAQDAGLHVVTDFVPSEVVETNTWYTNRSMSEFFYPNSRKLDFSSETLLDKIVELLSTTWKEKGVLGFLAQNVADEIEMNATTTITERLKSVGGAVVYGVMDVNHNISAFTPESYREFIDSHIDDWTYFKFNPKLAESTSSSRNVAKLVTTTLFLVPGTPILVGIEGDYFKTEKKFIQSLSEFREKESVQIGDMTYVNTTSEDVMAFARVMKGTPGCAVAVNFHPDNSTEVDFTNIKGVPKKGDVHIKIANSTYISGELKSTDLSKVHLQPYEGIVVLFVPDL